MLCVALPSADTDGVPNECAVAPIPGVCVIRFCMMLFPLAGDVFEIFTRLGAGDSQKSVPEYFHDVRPLYTRCENLCQAVALLE
jgi:hypothetical protein